MYNNHQSFFLPDGLSSSSNSSIESIFNSGSTSYPDSIWSNISDNQPSPLSSSSAANQDQSAFNRHLDHVINGKEGKMFVGGLSWLSTTDSMRSYFEKFGPVEECVIMRDAKTKITRGFGFVTFVEPLHMTRVLAVKDHFLDGKKIDPQIAIRHISPARSVNNICRKVFIGGVSQLCTVEDVKAYFSQFGQVEDAILKMDYPKQQHRGFGFMTFVNSETADFVCTIRYHTIKDKIVECKMAQKKEFVKPNGEAAAAASTFLNSLPPEQVLAIYGVLLKGIVDNNNQQINQQQMQHQIQQIQQLQQLSAVTQAPPKLPNPIAPPSTSIFHQAALSSSPLFGMNKENQEPPSQLPSLFDNSNYRQLAMKYLKQFQSGN